jgi:hypothetical protein
MNDLWLTQRLVRERYDQAIVLVSSQMDESAGEIRLTVHAPGLDEEVLSKSLHHSFSDVISLSERWITQVETIGNQVMINVAFYRDLFDEALDAILGMVPGYLLPVVAVDRRRVIVLRPGHKLVPVEWEYQVDTGDPESPFTFYRTVANPSAFMTCYLPKALHLHAPGLSAHVHGAVRQHDLFDRVSCGRMTIGDIFVTLRFRPWQTMPQTGRRKFIADIVTAIGNQVCPNGGHELVFMPHARPLELIEQDRQIQRAHRRALPVLFGAV